MQSTHALAATGAAAGAGGAELAGYSAISGHVAALGPPANPELIEPTDAGTSGAIAAFAALVRGGGFVQWR